MPLLHCDRCHHEFEGAKSDVCAWCGSSAHVIDGMTALERLIKEMIGGDDEEERLSRLCLRLRQVSGAHPAQVGNAQDKEAPDVD